MLSASTRVHCDAQVVTSFVLSLLTHKTSQQWQACRAYDAWPRVNVGQAGALRAYDGYADDDLYEDR